METKIIKITVDDPSSLNAYNIIYGKRIDFDDIQKGRVAWNIKEMSKNEVAYQLKNLVNFLKNALNKQNCPINVYFYISAEDANSPIYVTRVYLLTSIVDNSNLRLRIEFDTHVYNYYPYMFKFTWLTAISGRPGHSHYHAFEAIDFADFKDKFINWLEE